MPIAAPRLGQVPPIDRHCRIFASFQTSRRPEPDRPFPTASNEVSGKMEGIPHEAYDHRDEHAPRNVRRHRAGQPRRIATGLRGHGARSALNHQTCGPGHRVGRRHVSHRQRTPARAPAPAPASLWTCWSKALPDARLAVRFFLRARMPSGNRRRTPRPSPEDGHAPPAARSVPHDPRGLRVHPHHLQDVQDRVGLRQFGQAGGTRAQQSLPRQRARSPPAPSASSSPRSHAAPAAPRSVRRCPSRDTPRSTSRRSDATRRPSNRVSSSSISSCPTMRPGTCATKPRPASNHRLPRLTCAQPGATQPDP
jgi:hypothetical protein